MSKTTATRINNLHVSVRTATGAPRLFLAKVGEINRRHTCMCPKGSGQGCSHEVALMTLLHREAAEMATATQTTAHVVA